MLEHAVNTRTGERSHPGSGGEIAERPVLAGVRLRADGAEPGCAAV